MVMSSEIMVMTTMTIPGVTTGNYGAQLVERGVVKISSKVQLADELGTIFQINGQISQRSAG